jgi:hypothetical protein
MRKALVVLATLGVAACSEQAERTYTVDELVADEASFPDISTICRNHPGKLANTTKCRNAEAADGKPQLQRMRRSLGD